MATAPQPVSAAPFGIPDMGAMQPPNSDMADAMDVNGDLVSRAMHALRSYIASQRADASARGLWDDASGMPTAAGLGQAARAYAGGLSDGGVGGMMGAIKAYHGSPHSFDRFDISKIGTGEGAQAYGHGLYFAGNEGVARSYRDAVTRKQWGNTDDPSVMAYHAIKTEGSRAKAISRLETVSEEYMSKYGPGDPFTVNALAALAAVRSGNVAVKPKGHMYEVSLNTEPSRLLDWDKTYGQQSGEVKGAISRYADIASDAPGYMIPNAMGSNPVRAADALREAGVPGVQYLDQGSRAAGAGSHNYVMFDPKLIEILRKYAVPGMVAGTATAAPFGMAPQQ